MSRVGDNIKKAREEAKLPAKAVAKKLGISESNLIDIENGKKVINEALIQRISKILGKDINSMGLSSFEADSLKEESRERAQKIKAEKQVAVHKAQVKEKKGVNELWDQAFGNNLKSIPVFDMSLKSKKFSEIYPISNGKIENHSVEKVFSFQYEDTDMIHYGILKGSVLLAAQAKEVINEAFYIFEAEGQNYLRKCRNLGNGNILTLKNKGEEISKTYAAKDIKVLGTVFRVVSRL